MLTASQQWSVWSTQANLVVTDPEMLDAAVDIAKTVIASVDAACNRFTETSELNSLHGTMSNGRHVSGQLAELIEHALLAAQLTNGAVDPTLGNDLISAGYTTSFSPLAHTSSTNPGRSVVSVGVRTPGWKRIRLDGDLLTVPDDLRLDLGASAKAVTADTAAEQIAARLGTGVLVSLGGDIATAGHAPAEGWQVLIEDLPDDPSQQITLTAGFALATSSTQKRRWLQGGRPMHHILDPRFGTPAAPVWKTVTVAADTCLHANAFSTAAIVDGLHALSWFSADGVCARFVDQHNRVTTTSGWPTTEPATGTSGAWYG